MTITDLMILRWIENHTKKPLTLFLIYIDLIALACLSSFCAVSESSTFLENNFDKQLKYLNHAKYGATARQLLLTECLPHYDYERNMGAIADCLLADNCAVRHDAAARLERLIVVTKHRWGPDHFTTCYSSVLSQQGQHYWWKDGYDLLHVIIIIM